MNRTQLIDAIRANRRGECAASNLIAAKQSLLGRQFNQVFRKTLGVVYDLEKMWGVSGDVSVGPSTASAILETCPRRQRGRPLDDRSREAVRAWLEERRALMAEAVAHTRKAVVEADRSARMMGLLP